MCCFINRRKCLNKSELCKFKFLSSVGATRSQDARLSEADLLEDGVPAHALQWDGLVRHLNQHGRSLLSLSAAAVVRHSWPPRSCYGGRQPGPPRCSCAPAPARAAPTSPPWSSPGNQSKELTSKFGDKILNSEKNN